MRVSLIAAGVVIQSVGRVEAMRASHTEHQVAARQRGMCVQMCGILRPSVHYPMSCVTNGEPIRQEQQHVFRDKIQASQQHQAHIAIDIRRLSRVPPLNWTSLFYSNTSVVFVMSVARHTTTRLDATAHEIEMSIVARHCPTGRLLKQTVSLCLAYNSYVTTNSTLARLP